VCACGQLASQQATESQVAASVGDKSPPFALGLNLTTSIGDYLVVSAGELAPRLSLARDCG